MRALREAIEQQGKGIGTQIVKVDSFLNHRLDTGLIMQMGEAFAAHFAPGGAGAGHRTGAGAGGRGLAAVRPLL